MNHDLRSGRFTADFPEGTVVFLIGMRINRVWRVRQWLPAFMAMPKMLRELSQQPELGLLEARTWFGGRVIMVVQYWESMDKLMAYATAPEADHLPAWQAFNRRARSTPGSVGIFHEAYTVSPPSSHVIYAGMPRFGMGKATNSPPVGAYHSARQHRDSGYDVQGHATRFAPAGIDDPAP